MECAFKSLSVAQRPPTLQQKRHASHLSRERKTASGAPAVNSDAALQNGHGRIAETWVRSAGDYDRDGENMGRV
jgi:hypothetical protein